MPVCSRPVSEAALDCSPHRHRCPPAELGAPANRSVASPSLRRTTPAPAPVQGGARFPLAPPVMPATQQRRAAAAAATVAFATVLGMLRVASSDGLRQRCNPSLSWRPLQPGEPGQAVLEAVAAEAFLVLPEAATAPCNASDAEASVDGCSQVRLRVRAGGLPQPCCTPVPHVRLTEVGHHQRCMLLGWPCHRTSSACCSAWPSTSHVQATATGA